MRRAGRNLRPVFIALFILWNNLAVPAVGDATKEDDMSILTDALNAVEPEESKAAPKRRARRPVTVIVVPQQEPPAPKPEI